MAHKPTITFVIALFFVQQCAAFTVYDAPYRKEAETWSSTYLHNGQNGLLIPIGDLHLIANLCYFSFMRSYCTLKAQENALEAVAAVWKGWQNIARKRLDPSGDICHELTDEQKEKTTKRFWKAHDEHHAIGTTYAHAVNEIVHGNALTTIQALKGVNNLRSQARSVVAQALIDVRSLLGNLFYTSQKKSLGCLWKGWSFVKHLSNYIPQLALSSFVEADNLNNSVSAQAWKTVKTIQNVGVQTWEKIEEARASFYLAHYRAICTVMEKMQLEVPQLFNQTGHLCTDKQMELLPTKKNLQEFIDW